MKPPAPRLDAEDHIYKVRQICMSLPGTSEKLSHGEPTFFVAKKVFTMVANNHHNDGHIAVWIPAPSGLQQHLIGSAPEIYFNPPYVGVRGWIGIDLPAIDTEPLAAHILAAWQLTAPKKLQALRQT
ncbi:MmcQ/YjbR family DNA-binding protein [soil metagenome]